MPLWLKSKLFSCEYPNILIIRKQRLQGEVQDVFKRSQHSSKIQTLMNTVIVQFCTSSWSV